MNERIKEFALESGLAYKMNNGTYWIDAGEVDIHLERFADLIRKDEREVNENFEKMLFDMQNAAIHLSKVNQELVEALKYASAVIQGQLSTKTKQEYSLDKINAALDKARGYK
jgi:hypothetical protein